MDDLYTAVANAETALADVRVVLHRFRIELGDAKHLEVRETIQASYDLVVDIMNNIDDGREPFYKV